MEARGIMKYLTRPEEIVLLSVWRLGDNAYGVTIRELVQKLTGRYWSVGAVYVPLERLEKKGYVRSFGSPPLPERGGRSRRYFALTEAGMAELEEVKRVNLKIWRGFPGLAAEERKK